MALVCLPLTYRAGSRDHRTRSPPVAPFAVFSLELPKSLAGKQALLDKAANNVSGSNVDLLDQRRRVRGRP